MRQYQKELGTSLVGLGYTGDLQELGTCLANQAYQTAHASFQYAHNICLDQANPLPDRHMHTISIMIVGRVHQVLIIHLHMRL